MAATAVGSVAIQPSPAPRAAPLGRRATMLLPGFVGLRMSARIPRGSCVTIPAASARAIRRRGAVVCEAQETSVQLSGSSGAAVGVPEVSKATWQSLVMESDIPVLVDFWAPWCGPCRLIEPVIVQLSESFEGKIKCYKLNTDENPDITTQYGVRSIPTMMIFKNGEKKDAVIGAVPESTLLSSIEKFVSR